jgi:flagellar FliJ protein
MKRFAWRLQRLLDIKAKEEQIKRAELLGVTEKLAQTRGGLAMQKRLLKNIIDGLAEEPPAKRLARQELFLKSSVTNDELIEKLESRVRQLETQQKEKIAEVLKARRFKEGLEKLRVEAKSQFIKEQETLEQKEADEMAAIGFARKMTRQS